MDELRGDKSKFIFFLFSSHWLCHTDFVITVHNHIVVYRDKGLGFDDTIQILTHRHLKLCFSQNEKYILVSSA